VTAVPDRGLPARRRGHLSALRARAACAFCAGLAALPAAAQYAGGLRITTGLETSLTAVRSTLQGQGDNVVWQVHPGVQMTLGGGRLRGSLDYGLNFIHHTRPVPGLGQGDTVQNNLNAVLNAELLERWVYMDANASIAQQAISAYGQQSVDGVQTNTNRTEVSQLSVRPYASGAIGGWATYRVGLSADTYHTKTAQAPDSNSLGANLTLASASPGALLGWSAQASQQRSSFSGGQATDNGRLTASLLITPSPEWTGSLRGGQETTSVGNVYSQSYSNWGADLRWTPSARTTALLSSDERYFGRAHQVVLEHRFPSSSVRFTSTRDANNAANGAGVGQPTTIYQLFYAQFASIQPDPVLREQLVRATLLALNLNANAVVGGGFVNAGTTLQQREDLSLTYVGLRSSYTVQAFRSGVRRLDTANEGFDTTPVRQDGWTTTWSYRLTPTANINVTGSALRTLGTATQAGNHLKSLALSGTNQLSKYLSASFSARYSSFGAAVNPYRESALSASLILRF
jgi:uncharacterized protein (PEP-CTERM system associated)